MSTDMIIQIISLSLLVLVPLMLWGTRPSWWTVTGCLMYPFSVLVANAFHLAFYLLDPLPPEYAEAMELAMEGAPPSAYGFALRIFTASGLLLVGAYAMMVFFALGRPLAGRPRRATAVNLFQEGKDLIEYDEPEFPPVDFQARAVWLVVAIGECFAFVEYANCKLWIDPFGSNDLHLAQVWGIEVSRYACGRTLTSWAPFMPPIITSLYLVWINSRHGRAR